MFHRAFVIYLRLCKWVGVLIAMNFSLFLFFSVIATGSAGMPENAQPHDQNTYLVTVNSKHGNTTGYVRPGIGKTYDTWLPLTEWSLGGLILLILPALIVKRRSAKA